VPLAYAGGELVQAVKRSVATDGVTRAGWCCA